MYLAKPSTNIDHSAPAEEWFRCESVDRQTDATKRMQKMKVIGQTVQTGELKHTYIHPSKHTHTNTLMLPSALPPSFVVDNDYQVGKQRSLDICFYICSGHTCLDKMHIYIRSSEVLRGKHCKHHIHGDRLWGRQLSLGDTS